MSVYEDTGAPPIQTGEQRNPFGWIAMGVMVLLLLVSNLPTGKSRNSNRLQGYEDQMLLLQRVMSTQSLTKSVGLDLSKTGDNSDATLKDSLKDSISELVFDADKKPMASMLYAEMRTVRGESVPEEHLKVLETSKLKEDQAFAKIYTSPKLTKDEANQLINQLPKTPFVYVAARVQALEKAGEKDAALQLVSPKAAIGMTLIAIVGWPLFTLSFLFWIIVPRRLREGKLVHKGIPLASITPTDADRLAIRAAQIMFLFVVMEVLVVGVTQKLGLHISEMWSETMGGLLTVAGVFGLQYVPVMGKQIRLEYIGVSARDLGKNILLGVVGFVAEFPLALIVAVISTELLKWIPQGSHPAIEQLMKHPNASTVAAVVIAGSIVAPFWEEIVFRGLLFPGSSRLLGSMVSGLILSSFMFASSHPQGITMWLPLAFVGAASGVLSNYSRSLVPGMVMHSLHNAALFAVFLLMS